MRLRIEEYILREDFEVVTLNGIECNYFRKDNVIVAHVDGKSYIVKEDYIAKIVWLSTLVTPRKNRERKNQIKQMLKNAAELVINAAELATC